MRFRKYSSKLSLRFGLPYIHLFTGLGTAWAELIVTFPPKFIIKEGVSIDDRFIFVSPSFTIRREIDGHWTPPERFAQKSIIYVSLGTVFNKNMSLLHLFWKTLQSHQFGIVFSIKEEIQREMGLPPENFEVSSFFPQVDVLESTDIFVTHGGANGIVEALHAEVPMIVVPQAVDQFYSAGRIEALGLGRFIPEDEMTEELLMSTIQELLVDSKIRANLRERKRELVEGITNDDAVKRIIELIPKE